MELKGGSPIWTKLSIDAINICRWVLLEVPVRSLILCHSATMMFVSLRSYATWLLRFTALVTAEEVVEQIGGVDQGTYPCSYLYLFSPMGSNVYAQAFSAMSLCIHLKVRCGHRLFPSLNWFKYPIRSMAAVTFTASIKNVLPNNLLAVLY